MKKANYPEFLFACNIVSTTNHCKVTVKQSFIKEKPSGVSNVEFSNQRSAIIFGRYAFVPATCILFYLRKMVMVPRSIIRRSIVNIQRLIGFLVTGNNKRKPIASVINPGVSNTAAPSRIHMPSMISSLGAWPYDMACLALANVSNPCRFASHAPITPVRMIRKTTHQGPILLPDHTSTPISKAGTINTNNNIQRNIYYPLPPFIPLFTIFFN